MRLLTSNAVALGCPVRLTGQSAFTAQSHTQYRLAVRSYPTKIAISRRATTRHCRSDHPTQYWYWYWCWCHWSCDSAFGSDNTHHKRVCCPCAACNCIEYVQYTVSAHTTINRRYSVTKTCVLHQVSVTVWARACVWRINLRYVIV